MDILILDAFDAEVARWLGERHVVHHAAALMADAEGLRAAMRRARAVVAPTSLRVDGSLLAGAPRLRALARVGSQPPAAIDLDACERAGVEVVRHGGAQASAHAEFVIGALLQQWRRGAAQRELGGATIGLFGMQPAARSLATLLHAFGARVVGYDPSLHASDVLWPRWQIEPLPLRELMAECDAVCVLLPMFSRYRGLLGERVLASCKPGQVLVSLTHSSVFDDQVLAEALADGRITDVWLDDAEDGLCEPGRPLHGLPGVQLTPRLADNTREARERTAWAVARRIDALLGPPGRHQLPTVSRPAALYADPRAA